MPHKSIANISDAGSHTSVLSVLGNVAAYWQISTVLSFSVQIKSERELDKLKGLRLAELWLDGNPLCQHYKDQTVYIRLVPPSSPHRSQSAKPVRVMSRCGVCVTWWLFLFQSEAEKVIEILWFVVWSNKVICPAMLEELECVKAQVQAASRTIMYWGFLKLYHPVWWLCNTAWHLAASLFQRL